MQTVLSHPLFVPLVMTVIIIALFPLVAGYMVLVERKVLADLQGDLGESLRLQKLIASYETQAESHPDWAGKVYTKYDGSGYFNHADLGKIELAFTSQFS